MDSPALFDSADLPHLSTPGNWASEAFTDEETAVLRRHFTNIDKPVFALVNLPEVVKGALFARYSRSSSSLRRLFLDEFADEASAYADTTKISTAGEGRASDLYDRVFYEYGDDSVAQLGGAHLACEQSSNLLTKVLEWGRLMSYLEQSTRYVSYSEKLAGRYRYHRDEGVMASPLADRYVEDMDAIFEAYASLTATMTAFFQDAVAQTPGGSPSAYRRAVKARALDAVRGVLPAATLSNVGIYGSGQAYEALLHRMLAHPLPEAQSRAVLMLEELRKVIPSFLKRVDDPERGGRAVEYLAANRDAMDAAGAALSDNGSGDATDSVRLVDYDPHGEIKMISAMLYPHTSMSDAAIGAQVRAMSHQDRMSIIRAYCGERTNRRHRPGRALERTFYRFDVVSDYGAFRDLQRHRMLTIEWQPLSPLHGYNRPPEIEEAGASGAFDDAMSRSAALHEALAGTFPRQAPYALALAYRMRYAIQMNAREAMHVLELRTAPQGHPAYRSVCQTMHRLIASQAGHKAVAEMMQFVDHSSGVQLGRLRSEQLTEARLRQSSQVAPNGDPADPATAPS